MSKKTMVSMVIQKFGFEHAYSIDFVASAMHMKEADLEELLYQVLSLPIDEEDEEDWY